MAVADRRSFTRAAEDLHVAQQALSASVRRLEARLGLVLFERTTRHVELTPAGEALLGPAKAAVEAAATFADVAAGLVAGRAGTLTVGFSSAAGGVEVIRDILRAFARSHPAVDLRTAERDFSDPSAGLLDGAVQAAFVFGPPAAPELEAITLLEEPRLVAVEPAHALASRASASPSEVAGLAWLLRVPAPPGPWREFWFPEAPGALRGAVVRTADEWVAAVEAGRGAAFTMPSVMRNFTTARIATVPVDGLEPARLLLAWRAGDRGPLVSALRATARRILTRS